MRDKGFTLTELLLVIAIIGIGAALAAAGMAGFVRRNNIDNQIKRLHSDLQNVRVMAMSTSREHYVNFAGNQYSVFEERDGVAGLTGGDPQVLNRTGEDLKKGSPFTLTGASTQRDNYTWAGGVPNPLILTYNTRGILANPLLGTTICVVVPNIRPWHDCVVVSRTRISLGKLTNQLGACNAANCTIE